LSKIYKNPPVIEAVCEFRFKPESPWDGTIPGLLYSKIHDDFPIREDKIRFETKIRPHEKEILNEVTSTKRMHFLNNERTNLVQAGQNMLAINKLAPYTHWNDFKSLIGRILNEYKQIAPPKGFERIGLMYVNRLDFEETTIDLKEFFSLYPFIPDGLAPHHGDFILRINFPHENSRDNLFLIFESTKPKIPGGLSMFLNFDYSLLKPDEVSLGQVTDWLENAHNHIEDAFEKCVTEKCKERFN
jgi:uncharacterized protein (TIGR04255 family)